VEKTQKETEIRIIIFYFNNLINLFKEKLRAFLSYINLNRRIEAGEKKEIVNFKTLSNIFRYHIVHFFFIKH